MGYLFSTQRIDAIKHNDGAGCGLSHIKALELAVCSHENKNDYIIILEDDFTWSHDKEKTLETLNNALNKKTWNVILLAAARGITIKHDKYVSKIKNCQTTSGYIIRIGYIPNLLKIWKKDMLHRESSKEYVHKTCIDQSWKQLQNDDWYITNPKLGFQMGSYSDIEKKYVKYGV